jgi:enediyne biosynthesis protein E4
VGPGRGSARLGVVAAGALLLIGPPAIGPRTAARLPARFSDVTGSAGIRIAGLGNASSWVDYDGDGDLDLFASNSDFSARSYLYRNNGDWTFTDVTDGAGLGSLAVRSMAWADYDNDGHPDLAATTYGFRDRTRLFHNQGDGTFADVAAQAGMVSASTPWRVSWADYDRDGWVDLFQADGSADLLYHNQGDGTFTQVAQLAGVSDSAFSNDGAWADFNGDGWPDLFVGDEGTDHLYQNDGDGTFTDVTATASVSDPAESQSACWGDQDADGWLDLYVVDIDAVRNHLYRNDGDGTFTDITVAAGVGDVGDGRTCNWVDFDADGRLDLFTANHIHKNRLFRNNGDRTYTDVAAQAGIADPFDTFNAAWGDFDGDGALDLFAVGHSANVLFHDDGPTGGFVDFGLTGTRSNASAIGARVWLLFPGRKPSRVIEGGSGAYGQDSLTLEFGVGAAPGPFRARILWPSGNVQTLTAQANSLTWVIEPELREEEAP